MEPRNPTRQKPPSRSQEKTPLVIPNKINWKDKKPTLLRSRSIQHPENLQDIGISGIALEFIARAVKTQDELPTPARDLDNMGVRRLQMASVGCHGTGQRV